MFRNYFKIARRNLLRHKVFSLINIMGLTIGLTCCFLVIVFVRHELSYDQFHTRYDRIYRLNYMPKFAGYTQFLALTPPVASPLLPDYFSEIETSARVYRNNATIEIPSRTGARPVKFDEDHFYFADSTLTDIFSFHFIEGDPSTALKQAYSVVVSEKTARKYFGKGEALGRTIIYEGRHPLKVTGVIADMPDNSHIQIDLLSDFQTMFATESELARENLPQNWVITHSSTYVLLRPGKDPESVNARFPKFLATHADKELAKDIVYQLQPLSDIHLNADIEGNQEASGSMTSVFVFMGIGIATLLIACINFINLSTARSLKRSREVGIRKTLGGEKGQLVMQFLGESLLMSGLALAMAIILTALLLPVLNALTDKKLTVNYLFSNPWMSLVFVGITISAGLLSGSYPAFVVVRFRPILALKGNFANGKTSGGAVRHVLLALQFTTSIILIIGALVAYRQLNYLLEKSLGFDKDLIVTAGIQNEKITNVFAQAGDSTWSRLKTFQQNLLTNPGIEEVAFSTGLPGDGAVRRQVIPEGKTQETAMFMGTLGVDFNFVKTYHLQLVAGRALSDVFATDKDAGFLINETGMKQFGWKSSSEAIGKSVNMEGKQGRIVGVLKDFHNRSLQNPIEGMLLHIDLPHLTQVSIKLSGHRPEDVLYYIGSEWDKHFPAKGFDYHFLDQSIANAYLKERQLSKMIGYFAGLAILISCLGLYGLVAIVVQHRIREIGVRKVLGATVGSIVALVSRDFIILVVISLVIAAPTAWFAVDKWLANFAYKTSLTWWIFALAGILTMAITLVTVGFQSIKAAMINPVKSLCSE